MKAASYIIVTDRAGTRGVAESSQFDQSGKPVVVALAHGKQVQVPANALELQADGSYALSVEFDAHDMQTSQSTQHDDALVIPVILEEIEVGRQWVERGRLRVRKTTDEIEQTITESVTQELINVERVPINQPVDQPIQPRHEGDIFIIPVVEEVVVVQKQYILKEELRITKRQIQREVSQPVVLRRENVTIETIDPAKSES